MKFWGVGGGRRSGEQEWGEGFEKMVGRCFCVDGEWKEGDKKRGGKTMGKTVFG